MNRRSVLKGLLAVAAAAPGFRLPLVSCSGLFRQALRLRPGRWRLGSHQLLRPQGQYPGREGHQPLGGDRRGPPSRQHPVCPLRRQPSVLREVSPHDAGHQRRRRPDERALGRHRAQLERAKLRGLSDAGRALRRPLCADASGALSQLRRLLEHRWPDPLHPPRRSASAARDRLSRRRHGVVLQRRGLGGDGVASGRRRWRAFLRPRTCCRGTRCISASTARPSLRRV